VQAHPNVAEVAVVGVPTREGPGARRLRRGEGSAKVATPELAAAHEKEIMATVDKQLGAIARPRASAS
jgi:propionyl-CoA synthetase